jgi:hypothetical protein
MAYYFSKTLPIGFDEAIQKTTEALKRGASASLPKLT